MREPCGIGDSNAVVLAFDRIVSTFDAFVLERQGSSGSCVPRGTFSAYGPMCRKLLSSDAAEFAVLAKHIK